MPAVGHSWSDWALTTIPRCDKPGTLTRTCETCGESCAVEVPPTGTPPHLFEEGTVTLPPSGCLPGVRTHYCTVCGCTCTEPVPAVGAHCWNSGTVTTAPTCTAEGEMLCTCTVCGATVTQPVPALGHHWGPWVETIPPTETSEGTAVRTCLTDPSHTETQTIPALPAQPNPQPNPQPQPNQTGGGTSPVVQALKDLLKIITDFLQSFFSI